MCGIFAYCGHRDVKKVLIKGLKNLEYRGYDSAGIAFLNEGLVYRFRVCGGVEELENKLQTAVLSETSLNKPDELAKNLQTTELTTLYQTKKNLQASYPQATKELQSSKLTTSHQNTKEFLQANSHKNSLGIGHTRWATHGPPSEANAHPHKSDCIYVVHNGVIENTAEIKQIIKPQSLLSQTDTELIPHLIYHFYKKENLNFLQSIFKTVLLIKGSYAVVAINKQQSDQMIAFKSGPPLVLCKGDNEFFISSDPQAVGQKAHEVIYLEDEQILSLKGQQVKLFNFKGQELKLKFKKYSQAFVKNSKGSHPHFMIKEILEQPHSLSRLIDHHIDKNKQEVDFKLAKGDQKKFNSALKNSSELIFLACGSSYYSALFAKYFLEEISPCKVHVEIASEFIYKTNFLAKNSLVFFISQSGETADILTALKQTQALGLKSVSLCNVKNSSLDRKADFAFYMLAGAEVAVASTKAFSASLTALSLLSFYIAKLKNRAGVSPKLLELTRFKKTWLKLWLKAFSRVEKTLPQSLIRETSRLKKTWLKDKKKIKELILLEKSFVLSLLTLPSYMEKVLCCDKFFLKIMETLKNFKAFFYLGRGLYYPIALEGALKLKEIAYLHAEAYPSGEMKHGPLAMIDKNTAVLALLPPDGLLYKKSLINLKEVKSRGACIISIGGPSQDEELKSLSDYHLALPKSHKLLQPILALIPLQMMAYYISRSYGYNADRPRNLAKSVTVE